MHFLGATGTANVHANGVEITSSKVVFNGAQNIYLESDLTLNASNQTLQRVTSGDFSNNMKIILKGANPTISGSFTLENLTVTGTAVTTETLTLDSNITVTNFLVINGNSAINRLLVKSDTLGTQRTVTATGATVTITNADIRDIKGVGVGK